MLAQDTAFHTTLQQGFTGQFSEPGEDWRQAIAQVEAALCRSDVYRQALDQLQQLAAEHGASSQFLLKSVIRETIRLAIRYAHLEGQPESKPAPSPAIEIVEPAPLTPEEIAAREDAKTFAAIEQVLQPKAPQKKNLPHLGFPKREKPLTPEQIAEQAAAARTSQLRQLCARIKQEREARGLSLAQLHARTFIPMYHLQAIDTGNLDHLPTDIYLRGFLRRIEQSLSLPANSLTDPLPKAAPPQTVPTWCKTTPKPSKKLGGLEVQPMHLYLTYGAVMAGGIFWLTHQSSPQHSVAPIHIDDPHTSSPTTTVQTPQKSDSSKTKLPASQTVAAPETLR